jgi:Kdo2-lipid IVA lauroyltransferase/acyltransferase
MARKRNRPIQHFLFYATLFFFRIVSFLPLALTRKSAICLATIAYYAVPRIKKIGMDNLDIAYGDSLTRTEKEAILRGSVKNLALVALEFPQVPYLKNNMDSFNISVKGWDNIDAAKGCVIISAHLGNWEWLLPIGVHLGLRPIVVVRQFDDQRMDTIVNGIRQASGIKTVPKDAAMGPLLRRLQEGWHAGLLADQSPREDAVPVTFFGASTWATIGPAIIAKRSGTPIHPVSIIRDENNGYTVEFFPSLEQEDSGNTLNDLQTNTQRCQDALETMIRKTPEQWLWFHRRWKKRERLEKEWAARSAQRNDDAAVEDTATRPQKESKL